MTQAGHSSPAIRRWEKTALRRRGIFHWVTLAVAGRSCGIRDSTPFENLALNRRFSGLSAFASYSIASCAGCSGALVNAMIPKTTTSPAAGLMSRCEPETHFQGAEGGLTGLAVHCAGGS